jgi:Uma2 family endonuclease
MATATTSFVTVEQYLNTAYRPDVDYIDGKIEERAVGERDHSFLQRKLLLLLSTPMAEPYFICTGKLRVQVSPENYRVPDLVLLSAAAPVEQIVQTPPLLCIEILSPGDTIPEILIRARDYIHMGVPEVWLFDPRRRIVTIYDGSKLATHVDGLLTVPGTPIAVSIMEAFSVVQSAK